MRPPRVGPHALLLFAATLLFTGPVAAAAGAEGERPVIYRWVDADGVAHYTAHRDRVPSAVRDSLQEIQSAPVAPAASSGEPEPAAAADAAAPATTPAPAPALAPESSWATQNAGPAPAPVARGERGADGTLVASRASDAPADTSGLDARIAELEAQIAHDEEAIKDFLSTPPTEGGVALPETPEFREIAHRLPKLQADLRGLREQRGRAGASDDPLGSRSDRDAF